MPRSQRILQADLPVPDGIINISAFDLHLAPGGGTGTLTRIASGEWSLRISTTTASVVAASLSHVVTRFGMQDDLQEQFGSGIPNGAQGLAIGYPETLSTGSVVAATSVNIAVLSSTNFFVGQSVKVDTLASTVQEVTYVTAIPDATHITVNALVNAHTTPFPITGNVFTTPAGVSGSPPYTGITQLTPVTVARPKGIRLKQLNARYIINTSNATANTIGITQAVYGNGVAPTINTILANATNGLATAFAATPYVTPIPILPANQFFLTNKNQDVVVEWDVTAGTTIDLLGLALICDVNYN